MLRPSKVLSIRLPLGLPNSGPLPAWKHGDVIPLDLYYAGGSSSPAATVSPLKSGRIQRPEKQDHFLP